MKTAFDPRTRTWHRPFPASLAQHDLICQSPPEDAMQGLPLGNGDLGLMVWTEGSRLVAAVNKVDLFDDFPGAHDGTVGRPPYDHEPTLRHGARLMIDFGQPLFDVLFLEDFTARLSLADATLRIRAKTPFLSARIEAFASQPGQVIVLDCEVSADEPVAVQALLERFGSRPYPYWYSSFNRDATIGLSGTSTEIVGETLLIRQQLRTLNFVVAARMTGVRPTAERLHSRAGRLATQPAGHIRFQLLVTAVTSENAADPQAAALAILDKAAGTGAAELQAAHAADWRQFWQASFIDIPRDYLENIWYLNLYHANSACRGAWPPRFNNGLWAWNRDVANWVYYFHWNMQNFIWPLHTANHPELTRPYFNFRTRSLPNAMAYAKTFQGLTGAFYADVADRLGNNVGSHWDNQTPGAQIALLYWKHYQYTGDRTFLEQEAWPVMRETARYYAALVVQNEDGTYLTPCSQAYEGSPLFSEVITDTAMIKALMPAAVGCAGLLGVSGPEIDRWRDIGDHMTGFHTQPLEADEIAEDDEGVRTIRHGLGEGQPVQAGRVFSVGKYVRIEGEDRADFKMENLPDYIREPLAGVRKGDWMRNRFGNPARKTYYGIPDPEMAPVFPAGLIGLKDKGSELYKTSVDQVRLHPPTVTPESLGAGSMAGNDSNLCMGWCPYPVVLARLGLADEAATAAENSLKAWQFYSQGFGHYGPYEVFAKDKDNRWHTNQVTDVSSKERFPSPAWPFRHFTLEAIPIVCTTVNEMLIQSHDGSIRLLPAVPADWDGSFKLAAAGGFIVHGAYAGGRLTWAAIESKNGAVCQLICPWEQEAAWLQVLDRAGVVGQAGPVEAVRPAGAADRIITFETQPDNLYLLTPDAVSLDDWPVEPADFAENQAMKQLGKVQLGLPRLF